MPPDDDNLREPLSSHSDSLAHPHERRERKERKQKKELARLKHHVQLQNLKKAADQKSVNAGFKTASREEEVREERKGIWEKPTAEKILKQSQRQEEGMEQAKAEQEKNQAA